MAYHLLKVDKNIPLGLSPSEGHNRWHPDIPPMLTINPGDTVEIHTKDSWDCQITPTTTDEQVLSADLGRAHPLTGPVYVRGAQPGDLLAVHIDRIVPDAWGYTVVTPGFGFLRDMFDKPFIVHWEFADGYATSPQLPGIAIPGAPFMGVLGVAPSLEMVNTVSRREANLARTGATVFLPTVNQAVPSTGVVAGEGLRTIPPREFGGNMDIKQMVEGVTVNFPVFTEGALFSVGDAHFAQGDGETCGTAVETSAVFTATFNLLKGEAERMQQRTPSFSSRKPLHEPIFDKGYYATTGIGVTRDGVNTMEDATLSARNAVLSMMDYICDQLRYNRVQAYALTSVAANLRISQVVDLPNIVVTAFLPTGIFR